jgi:hypothetical protein
MVDTTESMRIKKGNIKLMVFDEFDFKELAKVVAAIEALGYVSTIVSNGNIVLQKKVI